MRRYRGRWLIGLGLFSSLILTGCANDAARYAEGAAAKAVMEHPVELPTLPADCRLREKHAPLVLGQDARLPLRRERHALDREHLREDRCNGWYDDLQKGMRGTSDK